MPTPQDVKRFENILKAAGFEIDDSEIGRLVQGDARRVTVEVLLGNLAEYHDLDHVPQYVLIGYGDGDKWGTFGYIDDLAGLKETAVDMRNDAEEITSVVAYDLDDGGKEVETYSEDWWTEYWEDDDESDDDYYDDDGYYGDEDDE